jgi:hypothetical protein
MEYTINVRLPVTLDVGVTYSAYKSEVTPHYDFRVHFMGRMVHHENSYKTRKSAETAGRKYIADWARDFRNQSI